MPVGEVSTGPGPRCRTTVVADGKVDEADRELAEPAAIIANTASTGGKTRFAGVVLSMISLTVCELKSGLSRWAIGAARAEAAARII